MPPRTQTDHLAAWLLAHGLTPDDADQITETAREQIYSVPPFRHGPLLVVGVRVTSGGAGYISREGNDAPNARQRATATLKQAEGLELPSLLNRCGDIAAAHPKLQATSRAATLERATAQGFVELGLLTATRSNDTVSFEPSALLLALEARAARRRPR